MNEFPFEFNVKTTLLNRTNSVNSSPSKSNSPSRQASIEKEIGFHNNKTHDPLLSYFRRREQHHSRSSRLDHRIPSNLQLIPDHSIKTNRVARSGSGKSFGEINQEKTLRSSWMNESEFSKRRVNGEISRNGNPVFNRSSPYDSQWSSWIKSFFSTQTKAPSQNPLLPSLSQTALPSYLSSSTTSTLIPTPSVILAQNEKVISTLTSFSSTFQNANHNNNSPNTYENGNDNKNKIKPSLGNCQLCRTLLQQVTALQQALTTQTTLSTQLYSDYQRLLLENQNMMNELESLTQSLFEEANLMVSHERKSNHELLEQNKKLKRVLKQSVDKKILLKKRLSFQNVGGRRINSSLVLNNQNDDGVKVVDFKNNVDTNDVKRIDENVGHQLYNDNVDCSSGTTANDNSNKSFEQQSSLFNDNSFVVQESDIEHLEQVLKSVRVMSRDGTSCSLYDWNEKQISNLEYQLSQTHLEHSETAVDI